MRRVYPPGSDNRVLYVLYIQKSHFYVATAHLIFTRVCYTAISSWILSLVQIVDGTQVDYSCHVHVAKCHMVH